MFASRGVSKARLMLLAALVMLWGAAWTARAPAAPPEGGGEFITIANGKFMLQGAEYKAIGVCNYPFIGANYAYTEREFKRAKAAGVTLIRCGVECFTSTYSDWNREAYWKKIDWALKVAKDLDMRVALDLSGYATTITRGLALDAYDPAQYGQWDTMVDFLTSRVNTFTGVAYRNDPTIFMYLIKGEVVPYGFTGDITNDSRDVNVIENLYAHVAARLRADDTHHLISAGGLLHVGSDVPKDSNNTQYWKTVWSNANIDCGALHIYLSDYTAAFPSGTWSSLSTYKNYCDSIGKPLVMEEFGIDLYQNSLSVAETYFNNVYNLLYARGIPVAIVWSWGPSGGFSVFPKHTDSLVSIISANAVRWGYTGAITQYEDSPVVTQNALFSFESSTDGFTSTGYGGNNGAPSRDSLRRTDGTSALCVPVNFASTNWNFAGVTRYLSPTQNWTAYNKVACDVWVPEGALALQIKFILTNVERGWVSHAQNGGIQNNWLDPGRWTTVYADLTSDSIDWDAQPAQGFNQMVQLTLEIHHAYGTPAVAGNVYIDNIRLGDDSITTPVELSGFAAE